MYDNLITLCAFLVSMQFYGHYVRFFEWAIDRCIGPRQEETTPLPTTTTPGTQLETAPDSHSDSSGDTTLCRESTTSITADTRIATGLDLIKAAIADKRACLPEGTTTVKTEAETEAEMKDKSRQKRVVHHLETITDLITIFQKHQNGEGW